MNLKIKRRLLRYLEAGKRNSGVDMSRIQEVHDTAVALGAKCDHQNVAGVMNQALEAEDNPNEDCIKKLKAKGLPFPLAVAICKKQTSTGVAENLDISIDLLNEKMAKEGWL